MPFDFDETFKEEGVKGPTEAPNTEAPPVTEVKTPEAPTLTSEVKTEAPKEHVVPLATFLDQRDQLNKLKDENAKLKPQEDPVEVPDRVRDPEGYEAYRNEQFQQVVLNERLNNSEMFAIQQHGEELVKNVQAWALEKFKAEPDFYRRITQSRHPYGAAIDAYNEAQVLKEVDPKELAEYKEWKKNKGGSPAAAGSPAASSPSAKSPAAPAAKEPPAKSPAPSSIADDPSAKGGRTAQPVGPGQGFSEMFKEE